jgi:hypothetical protein
MTMSDDDRLNANANPSGEDLRALIERFAALDPQERRRQIEAANAYLRSDEGRAEFGMPSRRSEDRPSSNVSGPRE